MPSRPTSKNPLKGRTQGHVQDKCRPHSPWPMVLARGHRTGTGHVRDTRGHAYFWVTQTIQFAPVDTQTMIIFTSTEAGFNKNL